MLLSRLWRGGGAWAVVTCLICSAAAGPAGSPCGGRAVELPQVCGGDLAPLCVSRALPSDVQGGLAQTSFNVVQRATDLFAWQTFIALQWPAGSPVVADPSKAVGGAGPSVWETWMEASEVYRADARGRPLPPLPWGTPEPLPASCAGATRTLPRLSKVAGGLDSTVQPTGADGTLPVVLTNQARELVRYEIRMNRVAYDAVVRNRWWDGTVQAGLDSVRFPVGSILVKAAWMPVSEREAPRFDTLRSCVCVPNADGSACTGVWEPRTMGLVGFHVMRKTESAPQWIWSTFEQVDNVASPGASSAASFYDPSCPGCALNRQTAARTPSQIARTTPIPGCSGAGCNAPDCSTVVPGALDNVVDLNARVQKALSGTPLRHYQLVNTQWPVPGGVAHPTRPTELAVLPPILANTALESFIQESSSCMGCHAMARSQRADRFVSADFSFTLNDAAPTLPDPNVLPGPDCQPSSADAKRAAVCRGASLATQTYELLPSHVGARLHCSSCHLNGGRNRNASWWVGMFTEFGSADALAARINHCFERSLNGKALCTTGPGGDCSSHPEMQALLAYMADLDARWNAGGRRPAAPADAFPPIDPGPTGDAARGSATYLQKCAFCHGVDGQGRYQHDSYFRPALWGDRSFNRSAGMGDASMFAAFVHGNMPLGSGGVLSAQEAVDVAAYVLAQPRPCPPGPPSDGCIRRDAAKP